MLLVCALWDNHEPTQKVKHCVPHSKRSMWTRISLRRFNNKLTCLAEKIEFRCRKFKLARYNRKRFANLKRAAVDLSSNKTCRPHNRAKMAIWAFSAMTSYSTTLTPLVTNSVHLDTDSGAVGVDNRCTACMSHVAEDFAGELKECNRAVKGFGGSRVTNIMEGTLKWKWSDDEGVIHTFTIPNSYCVPHGKARLLSPQHLAKAMKNKKGTGENTDGDECTLHWNDRKHKLTVPLDKQTNAATFTLAPGCDKFNAFCAECECDCQEEFIDPVIANPTEVVSDDETDAAAESEDKEPFYFDAEEVEDDKPRDFTFDLNGPTNTAGQNSDIPHVVDDEEDRQPTNLAAQLLRCHHACGHMPFPKLQVMAKQGVIPRQLRNCPVPACAACLCAKASRRPWRSKTSDNRDEVLELPEPGDVVSVDQLASPTPGLTAQITGKLTTKRHRHATVFVDQASRLGCVCLQQTCSADETLVAKKAFEKHAEVRGVIIKGCHADNGIFRANAWVKQCRVQGQALTFAGVNAHHQNGIAERRTRELQDLTRTSLIHATHRWPQCVTANLWPYAVRIADEDVNDTPSMQDSQRRTPQQIFSGTVVHANPKHRKHFGCPVFALDNALQGKRPFHKWKKRARVGVYLGRSPQHNQSVALALDRTAGHVSPQFHVKCDPCFHTTKDDTLGSWWQIKAGFVAQREVQKSAPARKKRRAETSGPAPEADLHGTEPSDAELTHGDPNTGAQDATAESEGAPTLKRKRTPPMQSQTEKADETAQLHATTDQKSPEDGLPDVTVSPEHKSDTMNDESTPPYPKMVKISDIQESECNPVAHVQSDAQRDSGLQCHTVERCTEAFAAETSANTKASVIGEIMCFEALYPTDDSDSHLDPLLAFKTAADPDTMHMHEAMREPDKEQFMQAVEKEVNDQMRHGNYTTVKKSSVPKGATVFPAVWSMRRKRDIKTQRVKKWKARLNLDGSRMKKGIHCDETCAPAVKWNSARTLLIMTLVHGWHAKQLDCVQACPQAPVERELHMKTPKGFNIDGNKNDCVSRLNDNVCGQKQAGRAWNKYLVDKLINELHFKQSEVDECVFYKGKTMYMLHTDDSILAGPDATEIDDIAKQMADAKLAVTEEGDLNDFLGVNIDRRSDGAIHMSQPLLIKQTLKELRLDQDNVKTKSTPAASSQISHRHPNSKPHDNSFHFKSAIGKLNCLEKASRSDISCITHQCARFVSNPKIEHTRAMRWLGRYLKGTVDKGTALRPDPSRGLEVYVDADFAGNWDPKDTSNPDTARSRHGCCIMCAGCPITWKSQLQTEFALSSAESEYTGLSCALREAIPVMESLNEMKANGFKVHTATPEVHCKVFEDNSGALEMARTCKFRPRTKHLNCRLHHFRHCVERGSTSVHPIASEDQLADMSTKPVNETTIVRLRKLVLGW